MQKVGLNTKAASVAAFNLEETEMASKSSWRTQVFHNFLWGENKGIFFVFSSSPSIIAI